MDTKKVSKPDLAENKDPHIGKIVNGRYLIEKELGRGGIGVVYLAQDKQLLNKRVVIKVLLDQSLEDEWLKKKFYQEIEALSRIEHPNIVSILDVGTMPSDTPYFVMQFVEGLTLRSEIKRQKIELPRAANIIRQIGQALTLIHEKGIYHRDLKPENIMLQNFGEGDEVVKIIDFGIAKIENSQLDVLTSSSTIVGTYIYMAPEQLMAKGSSTLTDIFTFGVIAYEIITGKRPFNPFSVFELLDLHRKELEILPTQLRNDLPVSAETIILKALSFDPTARYQRARDFAEELAKALSTVEEIVLTRKFDTPGNTNSMANNKVSPDALNVFNPTPQSNAILLKDLEPVGGAIPLESGFYIVRPVDQAFYQAITRGDSIVLIKGARQMGKTSLLARGLQEARKINANVVFIDFQRFNSSHLSSIDSLFLALAELIADQLDLTVYPKEVWHPERGASINFERYIRREVLKKLSSPLVWGLDEVDRLFNYDFSSEIFGLFRSWHNARSLDPSAPWSNLTLAIAYATEAHFFISDINQSPFNVGTRLTLEDFNIEQVSELNDRYGSPLKNTSEILQFFQLVNGHPYLVRRGLHEIVSHSINIKTLEQLSCKDEGCFGDHLRRILVSLNQEPKLSQTIKGILEGSSYPTKENFYRLRSVGLISGDSPQDAKLRCKLYETYLRQQL
ncbi:MAG: AAA-like domain-containing protein [Acidobacteria bacterium]|nr:AAA-like domain-containing protein [Acidobacteriota bacterium]